MKRNAVVTGLALLGLLGACAERELILPGERFDLRAPLEASLPVEGQPAPRDTSRFVQNVSQPISLPGVTANADWTHRAGNSRHLPPHAALSAAPVRVWTANIGTGNSRRYRSATIPIVAGGRVFTLDSQSHLAATSTGGGALWSVDLTPGNDRAGDASGGGLGYGDGKVFVATGYGELIAVNPASGAVIWRQQLEAPVTGAPTVEGGMVYVVGRDSSAWGVDTANGRVRWQVPAVPQATGMIGSAGPAIAGDTVILPFSSGEIVAVRRDSGERVWGGVVAGQRAGRAYGTIGGVTADPVVAGAVTYVGTPSGRTAALSTATGEKLWTATEGALGPVAAVGGSVFLVNDEARLVRLDAESGAVIWSVEMPYFTKEKIKRRKAIFAHYGPVLAGGRLVVASSDNLIRFFSPVNGALVGSVELPGGAASAPAFAGGVMYVMSGNGQLHAFR
ncbi:PQQ-binding-like beta-propeller repeat protein [Paracoccaceae bacterium Fryx2]|nr:PQQ-binding-like beta-propeller repeat protein [Paracoccaceae bacterium Fryx2]